ncbi:MAG: hypothetical protein QXG99_03050 [Conexivisphaerales archaeon]
MKLDILHVPPSDLQLIEFGWKDVKREVSGMTRLYLNGIAPKLFNDRNMNYAKY